MTFGIIVLALLVLFGMFDDGSDYHEWVTRIGGE